MSRRPKAPDQRYADLPVTELGRRVRSGEASAVEVLESFVGRLRARNRAVNAIVAERIPEAMAEARAIDEAVAEGRDPGPLAGVPFTTKEMASVEGMPVTAGSLGRRDAISHRDSTYVARLRAAGAIPLGVTNQSELGLWWESYNKVYGRTNNPYDARRTAGGSSGGEGAAVTTAMTGFGIGSDMGGSIRLPSMFNGIYGHKPTFGRVPVSGHFPLDYSNRRLETPADHRLIAVGPMARDPRDLLPLLDVISGPCDDDGYAREMELHAPVGADTLRVFFLEDPGIRLASSTSATQSAAVRRAARALTDIGARVRQWDGPSFAQGMDLYSGMLTETSNDVGLEEILTGKERIGLLREATRVFRGKSPHGAPALLAVLGERLIKPSERRTAKLVAAAERLRDQIDETLGDDGVLVIPTFPIVAPRHGGTLYRPFDFAYTALFNATDHPVTAVPMGIDPRTNLPTGVQIVGARGRDHLGVSAAIGLFEKGVSAWIPPADHRR